MSFISALNYGHYNNHPGQVKLGAFSIWQFQKSTEMATRSLKLATPKPFLGYETRLHGLRVGGVRVEARNSRNVLNKADRFELGSPHM
jgi:hypothetical protein